MVPSRDLLNVHLRFFQAKPSEPSVAEYAQGHLGPVAFHSLLEMGPDHQQTGSEIRPGHLQHSLGRLPSELRSSICSYGYLTK